jgi:hypothetical protein
MGRHIEQGTFGRALDRRHALAVRGIAGLLGINSLMAGYDLASYSKPVKPLPVRAVATPLAQHHEVAPQPVRHLEPKATHKAVPKPSPRPRPSVRRKPEAPKVDFGPISLAQYRSNPYFYLKKLPTLEDLHKQFPKLYPEQDVQELQAKINELKTAVHPTIDDYKKLSIDTSQDRSFVTHPYYNERSNMQLFAFHWSAEDHDLTPAQLAYKMMHRKTASGSLLRTSVAFIEGHQDQPVVSEMIEGLGHKTATVAGANDFSQSVEIAAEIVNNRSPLFDMTPEQLTTAVVLGVKVLRERHLSVEAWRLVDHTEMDLLFNNDAYSPDTGRFAAGAELRKSDFPPGVMSQIIVPEALHLNAELNTAGIKY